MNVFQGKLKYYTVEEGKSKKKSEAYLIQALTYTDAEALMNQFAIDNLGIPDFEIQSISQFKTQEFDKKAFEPVEDNFFYKVIVDLISFDDKKRKEKRTPYIIITLAKEADAAYDNVQEMMGLTEDHKIKTITQLKVLGIIKK